VDLLHCHGNNTIINIFEFDFLINDLTDTIQSLIASVKEQIQTLNQTGLYTQALSDLSTYESNTVNLNFVQNTNLPDVHKQLHNVTTQLDQVINNPLYLFSLQAVNNITTNLHLSNGTVLHLYYDPSNISTLNCEADPYDKLDNVTQTDLCVKASSAIALTIARNRAIAQASAINGNITDINNRLYGLEDTLPTMLYYQNETSLWASQIHGNLTDAYNQAQEKIYIGGLVLDTVSTMIDVEVLVILNSTACTYVGSAYMSLSHILCSDIRPALQILSAMMILGGLVLFGTTIISMAIVHKLKKNYYGNN